MTPNLEKMIGQALLVEKIVLKANEPNRDSH